MLYFYNVKDKLIKRLIIYSFLAFFLFALYSCEEEFIVENYDYTEKLVVNSIFSSDSSWVLNLSTTKNSFDERSFIRNVDNAEIFILDDNQNEICKLYNIGNGKYVNTNFYPNNVGTYHLMVNHEKFQTLRAFSKIPEKPNVENVVIEVGKLPEKTVLTFDILNKNLTDEVFVWDIVTKEENANDFVSLVLPDSKNIQTPLSNNTFKPFDFITGSISNSNPVFTDSEELFGLDSKSTNVNVSIESNSNDDIVSVIFNESDNDSGDGGNGGSGSGSGGSGSSGGQTEDGGEGPQKYIRIMTVSRELYDYFVSIEKFYASQQIGTSSINPTEIYSNIENGLGIFGAYSTVLIPLQ